MFDRRDFLLNKDLFYSVFAPDEFTLNNKLVVLSR